MSILGNVLGTTALTGIRWRATTSARTQRMDSWIMRMADVLQEDEGGFLVEGGVRDVAEAVLLSAARASASQARKRAE